MLDFMQINPTMTADWRDHPAPATSSLFAFRWLRKAARDGPKKRPCLVLDVEEIGGERFALLAYGTTSRRSSNVGYEIHVRKRAEFTAAGLVEPTRFVGQRRLLVPLGHSGFVICRATSSPVLGRLDGDPLRRLHAVRGRIHAERDIAASRRTDGGRRQPQMSARGAPRPSRDFVASPVERLGARAPQGSVMSAAPTMPDELSRSRNSSRPPTLRPARLSSS